MAQAKRANVRLTEEEARHLTPVGVTAVTVQLERQQADVCCQGWSDAHQVFSSSSRTLPAVIWIKRASIKLRPLNKRNISFQHPCESTAATLCGFIWSLSVRGSCSNEAFMESVVHCY